ncbi:putative membrane protein [Synechococcus sp. NOUM97013]|nr:putative membrane protein [Synechococcus sp. NOUM97013]
MDFIFFEAMMNPFVAIVFASIVFGRFIACFCGLIFCCLRMSR